MVHGAVAEGRRGAQWALAMGARRVVVIGAGAAGLAAAGELAAAGVETEVLEARHRVGGRVHSADLGTRANGSPVRVDAGAAWLQQWPTNDLARRVEEAGMTTVPTDFAAALAASPRGESSEHLGKSVAAACAALQARAAGASTTMSMHDAWSPYLAEIDEGSRLAAQRAVEVDLALEHGVEPLEWGVRAFDEGGVGIGDRWLPGGYQTALSLLSWDGGTATVRTGRAVRALSWDRDGVRVQHEAVDELGVGSGARAETTADVCVCTVPAWLLATIDLRPGLPEGHRAALSVLRPARVDKVLLRFDDRWWPSSGGSVMRWYDEPSGWGEWFDLTDGLGVPVVAGFCAGEAVTRLVDGRSDEEVVGEAVDSLRRFSASLC